MKVVQQYIVGYKNRIQVLYQLENGDYYISTNGAFNQRDTTIECIPEEEALKLKWNKKKD